MKTRTVASCDSLVYGMAFLWVTREINGWVITESAVPPMLSRKAPSLMERGQSGRFYLGPLPGEEHDFKEVIKESLRGSSWRFPRMLRWKIWTKLNQASLRCSCNRAIPAALTRLPTTTTTTAASPCLLKQSHEKTGLDACRVDTCIFFTFRDSICLKHTSASPHVVDRTSGPTSGGLNHCRHQLRHIKAWLFAIVMIKWFKIHCFMVTHPLQDFTF